MGYRAWLSDSKVMALVAAMVMVLSLGVTAWAANANVTAQTDRTKENDGKVSVSGTLAGQTYTLYKLFDADMGANGAITYTTNLDLTGNKWFELNDNGFVVAKEAYQNDNAWAKDPEAIAWAKANGTLVGEKKTANKDDEAVEWTGLAYGYYFVDTTAGSFIGIDSTTPEVEIEEKNELPSVDKEIVSTTSGVVRDDPAKSAENDKGKNEAATAKVGDTISYRVTVSAKAGAENYVVTDTLSEGLTAPSKDAVTVAGLTENKDYTVSISGQVITVTFTKEYLDAINKDTDIVITYTAVLNEKAVVGADGNGNDVKLTWGHDNTDNHSGDDAKVYTAQISVVKNDGDKKGLAGAEFALKNSDGKYYKWNAEAIEAKDAVGEEGEDGYEPAVEAEPAGVVWVDDVSIATKFTSGNDGKLSGIFKGLSNGVYWLEETVVPEGYNAISATDDSLKFEIKDDDYADTNLIQEKTVINNAGTELPSTGGIGTTIFYVAGAVLILGAGVLLITRRRMKNV